MLRSFLLKLIKIYKLVFSWKRPSCRYIPTCSSYAIESISKYGAIKGGWLTFRRILRCRPGFRKHSNCGYDPVP